MNLAICSLSSGSSGNCYVVKSDNTTLLVDAGISCARICNGLSDLGLDISDVDGVLITHEHSDHVKGIAVLQKKTGKFFATEKTFCGMECELPEEKKHSFSSGDSFFIGDIEIQSFSLSHDTPDPVGYSFKKGGMQISIITDTGIVTDEIFDQIKTADIMALESNHDVNVLKMGPYPWFLKQRILSDKGHLSNEAAALALAEAIKAEKKERLVLLAHLSKENNFPQMALATMENVLQEKECSMRSVRFEVLSRSERSQMFYI